MSIGDKIKREITEIEHRADISDEQKVSRITHIPCATRAGAAIQPIPFADIFVLTPIHAYFASRIAAIRGVPVSESDASDWIKEIIGMGISAADRHRYLESWHLWPWRPAHHPTRLRSHDET